MFQRRQIVEDAGRQGCQLVFEQAQGFQRRQIVEDARGQGCQLGFEQAQVFQRRQIVEDTRGQGCQRMAPQVHLFQRRQIVEVASPQRGDAPSADTQTCYGRHPVGWYGCAVVGVQFQRRQNLGLYFRRPVANVDGLGGERQACGQHQDGGDGPRLRPILAL